MNSVKLEETAETKTSIAPEDQTLSLFCAHMADGLHAMAQPLMVLRSALAASTMHEMPPTERERYLSISAQQIENACSVFESLRDLVVINQYPADQTPIELTTLLESVCDAQQEIFRNAGLELVFATPGRLRTAVGDKDRTLQALFALLKVMAAVSSPGDRIELSALDFAPAEIGMTIQNLRMHSRNLKSSNRLSLALAEANIRSQRGNFRLVEEPWRVVFTLPTMREES